MKTISIHKEGIIQVKTTNERTIKTMISYIGGIKKGKLEVYIIIRMLEGEEIHLIHGRRIMIKAGTIKSIIIDINMKTDIKIKGMISLKSI